MRLGGVGEQPQAQLDGFKSRALRSEAPAQRHCYTTEWNTYNEAEGQGGVTLLVDDGAWSYKYERLSSRATRHKLAAEVGSGKWAVIAMAVGTQRSSAARLPLFALETALTIVQAQAINVQHRTNKRYLLV